jgi:hypothetical protein
MQVMQTISLTLKTLPCADEAGGTGCPHRGPDRDGGAAATPGRKRADLASGEQHHPLACVLTYVARTRFLLRPPPALRMQL